MTFSENRTVYLTQDEDLVATPVGVSDNVGTLFNRSKPEPMGEFFTNKTTGERTTRTGQPIVEQAVSAAEQSQSAAEAERQNILNREESRIAQQGDRTREVLSDAQSQAEAARINRAKRRELLTARERGNISAPLNVRKASQIGTRGGFTAGTGQDKAAQDLIERRISADPELNRLNAIESGNINRINTIQDKLRTTRVGDAQALDDLKAELETLNADLKSNEQEKAVKSIDSFIDTIGIEEFGNLKADGLISYVESLTDDPGTLQSVLARQAIAKQIAETKDEDERAVLIDKLASLKGLSGAAAAVGTSLILDEALSTGEITQELYDSLTESLPKTTPTEIPDYNRTGVGSKTGVTKNPNGSVWFGNPLPNRVECGEYVNDALGIPAGAAGRMGDDFGSKVKNTPSATPIVGGSFSVNMGANGHCGLVERVHEDGSIEIADTNRDLKRDGEVKRQILKPNDNGQYVLDGVPIAGFGAAPSGIEETGASATTQEVDTAGLTFDGLTAGLPDGRSITFPTQEALDEFNSDQGVKDDISPDQTASIGNKTLDTNNLNLDEAINNVLNLSADREKAFGK